MQSILDQRVSGVPVHRFRLVAKDENGIEKGQSFSTSWERSAKAYSLQSQGYTVTATNWNKDTDEFDDSTELALTEGFNRANRAKLASKNAPKADKPVNPGLKPAVADSIKAHAELTKMVASVGRKEGVDDETKRTVGMSAMEMLTNIGYTPKEIADLAKAYVQSMRVSEHTQS